MAEEVIFRAMLFALWRDAGSPVLSAALCTLVAFGLWHITPTIIGVHMNDPTASARKLNAMLFGDVLFTTVAGHGLTLLRIESGGLLAPIILHAGINSVAALAAVRAGRRNHRLYAIRP